MYRLMFYTIVAAGLLSAQDAASLATLRQSAEHEAQNWDTLAKSLETRIRGMLPCDPKIGAAVEEVSRASDSRLSAFDRYFRAALTETSARTAQAAQLLDFQSKAGSGFLETEHAEGVEERAGTENQISQLEATPGRKAELIDSGSALRAVAVLTDRRNQVMVQQSTRGDSLNESLRALVSQSQAAEEAMKALVADHANEATRWRAYYVARVARVEAECSAINPTAAPRPKADRGKSPRTPAPRELAQRKLAPREPAQ
jgi:hypothetical protein